MNCTEVGKILDAYLDNELDVVHSSAVEKHLSACEKCRKKAEARRSLIQLLRTADLMEPPPPELGLSVRNAVYGKELETPSTVSAFWRPVAIAAAVLFFIVLGFHLLLRHAPAGSNVLADQLYQDHIRSLLANHLTDVVSSDQHTVKPWFDGKVNYSPLVKDLRDSGFALLGGRLDVLENQRVAAIVYGRRQHIINLFIWPQPGQNEAGMEDDSRSGYHLLSWSGNGMRYCAVSDLNTDELGEFVRMIRE
ncbi:MAG TPA: anti-sigma factor [Bacteroidota bacterium]|nr:anti-sigma factor [Bacteroidota bacterium]